MLVNGSDREIVEKMLDSPKRRSPSNMSRFAIARSLHAYRQSFSNVDSFLRSIRLDLETRGIARASLDQALRRISIGCTQQLASLRRRCQVFTIVFVLS